MTGCAAACRGSISLPPTAAYWVHRCVPTRGQIDARKVCNTDDHSQSHDGHDFTAVLTDQERRAIVEYLKTL